LNLATHSETFGNLPFGCKAFGAGAFSSKGYRRLKKWSNEFQNCSALLVLAGSDTAQVEGISVAGATPQARRYTAVADAEFLLKGPKGEKNCSLPTLPEGVSPALISHAACSLTGLSPLVLAVGLHQMPLFPHLRLELPSFGPAACLSTGQAMNLERVQSLWEKGYSMGLKVRRPILLAECVPGGTTTAQAILTGLGLSIADLISGSGLNPPIAIKKNLVDCGLKAANLGEKPQAKKLVAAVGDPFQPVAAGILLGAREAGQQVLLGGGSQMLAVLALALSEIKTSLRESFVEGVVLGTTSWLAEESQLKGNGESSLTRLLNIVGCHYQVELVGLSSGLRFDQSRFKVLRDYEKGYIKEGVGAGAFTLLAQFQGISCKKLVSRCEESLEHLK